MISKARSKAVKEWQMFKEFQLSCGPKLGWCKQESPLFASLYICVIDAKIGMSILKRLNSICLV